MNMGGEGLAMDRALAARDTSSPMRVALAGTSSGPGADHTGWPCRVPLSVDDDTGMTWQVRRAWLDKAPGEYVLEVLAAGRPGVRGAHLRQGHFELIPLDDPGLPALRQEAQQGEVISYMPYRRAVIRTEDRYIKIYPPGGAIVTADLCAQIDVLLEAGNFTAPRILRQNSQDVIVFSAIPGPTLNELGEDDSASGDETFTKAWKKWSHAWVAQLSSPYGPSGRGVLGTAVCNIDFHVILLERGGRGPADLGGLNGSIAQVVA